MNLFFVDENLWFTGGFVRAMAWNPQTFKDGFQKPQYLAIATYRDITTVQPYSDVKSASGLIQIWECRQLSIDERYVKISFFEQIQFTLNCLINLIYSRI